MANSNWGNETTITELNLLGFGNAERLQIYLFLLFLFIYICTMAGNLLIILLVISEQQLHTPMYFFLANLSSLDSCTVSTILPKVLAGCLTGNRAIPVWGCIAQFYFFASLVATQCYLLAMMSYDRYLAICKPLHYTTLMNSSLCFRLATGSWINGFIGMSVYIVLMSQLIFCGPKDIDHFFCDVAPLMKLACSDTKTMELVTSIFSSIFTLPPFILTLTSYIFIVSRIMRIPSTMEKKKAFSTCSSHLLVVSLFYGTLIIVYVLPKTDRLKTLNEFFSIFYSVLTPLVNPLIYSLRNREMKKALRKFLGKYVNFLRHQEI
ncbi:olfactory receptor 5B21-like [Rhineura floridana]|uniref:olfactory receptor 5B21-like n=1 Tax=Rhineura floridana TaxID=261503 RepID=UPI002AC7F8C0|nr:olfactory receptor 5B21-like [Rhineura floridana]